MRAEKIRQWFKKQERSENIVHGRDALDRELRRLARTSLKAIGHDRVAEIAKAYAYDTVDDFYAAIGYGAVGAQQVVTRLGVVDDTAQDTLPERGAPSVHRPHRRRPRQGRRRPPRPVRGLLPPDPRRPDRRVHHARQGRDGPSALVRHRRRASASAPGSSTSNGRSRRRQTYPIAIIVEAQDRTGLLNDITQIMAEQKVNILAASVGVTPDNMARVKATLQVASVAQLARVMGRIEQLKGVTSVQRDIG